MDCCTNGPFIEVFHPLIAIARNLNSILVIDMTIAYIGCWRLYRTTQALRQKGRVSYTLFGIALQMFELHETQCPLDVCHAQIVAQLCMLITLLLSLVAQYTDKIGRAHV